MSDINILKAVTDRVALEAEEDGRWDSAEKAVDAILHLLYETAESAPLWQPIYDAIVRAYGLTADWGDE